MDNTRSTTACVKCSRLRTRRLNFAHPQPYVSRASGGNVTSPAGPSDSRDSGVSSNGGGSQDCGEITPTMENKGFAHFQRFPVTRSTSGSDRTSVQFSQLVRKLSEVEGISPSNILKSMKTSIDEGVELDYSDPTISDSSSGGLVPTSYTKSNKGDTGSYDVTAKDSSRGSSTSTASSNYESIDNFGLDPGWTQSLPSCTPQPHQELTQVVSSRQPVRYNPLACQPQYYQAQVLDRATTRSPVNFREGRRSSDGGHQGIIAFQQRLYDKDKASGVFQLHEARQEVRQLQSQYGEEEHAEDLQSQSESIQDGQAFLNHRQSISKKVSVPENFPFFPSTGDSNSLMSVNRVALQQQLMQHRLQKKRDNIQKQRLPHGETMNNPPTARRFHQRPQGFSKPYLPQDALPLMPQGSEFLFQPIAEDEPSPVENQMLGQNFGTEWQQGLPQTCLPGLFPETGGHGIQESAMHCIPETSQQHKEITPAGSSDWQTFQLPSDPAANWQDSQESSHQQLVSASWQPGDCPVGWQGLPGQMELGCKLNDSPTNSPPLTNKNPTNRPQKWHQDEPKIDQLFERQMEI